MEKAIIKKACLAALLGVKAGSFKHCSSQKAILRVPIF